MERQDLPVSIDELRASDSPKAVRITSCFVRESHKSRELYYLSPHEEDLAGNVLYREQRKIVDICRENLSHQNNRFCFPGRLASISMLTAF